MALVPVTGVVATQSDRKAIEKKPDVHVLGEEEYIENLEKIITKDFFPDLPKLQAQAEYLDAIERKDTQKIWQLQQKFSQKRTSVRTPSVYGTPSTFDTPEVRTSATPVRVAGKSEIVHNTAVEEEPTHNPEPDSDTKKSLSNTSLDKFLSKNTSEDNISFSEIMKESEKKQRQKNAWLYEKVAEQLEEKEKSLALPSIEQQAIEPAVSGVKTWTYVLKNSVMYVPDGAPETAEESIQRVGRNREIVHRNTRFTERPFNPDKSKESLSQAASAQARVQPGRIGPDGKEILPAQSPKVGGYGFVATPSPAPGVDASPLMTWGEIEGTPFRLDGSDTPIIGSTRGPMFKIPDVPRRDRLLYELAEKTSIARRDKKEKALKQATASFSSPSPQFGMSKTERLQVLSPAAQRLASKKLGIRMNSDKALAASYTPSPLANRTPGDKTPNLATPSPSSSARSTPGSVTPSSGATKTPKRANRESTSAAAAATSLTDNLLNLPKRARAQEFF